MSRGGVSGFDISSGERILVSEDNDFSISQTLGTLQFGDEECIVLDQRAVTPTVPYPYRLRNVFFDGHIRNHRLHPEKNERVVISNDQLFFCRWDERRVDVWRGQIQRKHAELNMDDTQVPPSAVAIRAERLTLISSQGDCRFLDLNVII